MQIRITHTGGGDWIVVCGTRFEARLTHEEVLWVVVSLMTGNDAPRGGLKTVQDEMKRAGGLRQSGLAIESMSEVVQQLRADQREAAIGPLDD